MLDPREDIVAISRSQRLAMTAADDLCRIETFLDEDGDETDDPDAAAFAVGQLPTGRWFSLDLSCFSAVALN